MSIRVSQRISKSMSISMPWWIAIIYFPIVASFWVGAWFLWWLFVFGWYLTFVWPARAVIWLVRQTDPEKARLWQNRYATLNAKVRRVLG